MNAIVTFTLSRVYFYCDIDEISDFCMYLYMVKSYRNYRLIKYQKKDNDDFVRLESDMTLN